MLLAEYEELEEINFLMLKLFESKLQDSYTKEGIGVFKNEISLSSLQKRFFKGSLFYIYKKIKEL